MRSPVAWDCCSLAAALLPNRTELVEAFGEHRREYLVELLVQPNCPLVGQTVEAAGLRRLPGLFLVEIDRQGEVITPVAPHHRVQVHDRLVFTGVVSTIVDLEKIPGLIPAADLSYDVNPESRQQRRLTEVVLSPSSPLDWTDAARGELSSARTTRRWSRCIATASG